MPFDSPILLAPGSEGSLGMESTEEASRHKALSIGRWVLEVDVVSGESPPTPRPPAPAQRRCRLFARAITMPMGFLKEAAMLPGAIETREAREGLQPYEARDGRAYAVIEVRDARAAP